MVVQLLQLHWLSHWLLSLSLSFSSAFTFIHSIFLILSLVSKVWERTTWRFSTTPNTPPHVILQLVVPCSAHLLSWAPLSFSAIEVATQNMPYILVYKDWSSNFLPFQGQFGYGNPEDLWVNGGVPFTSAPATTTHNNNAYFVQVSCLTTRIPKVFNP